MKDNNYNIILTKLVQDLLIDNKNRNRNAELGKYLDIVSFPIFRHGNFNVTYNEYQFKKKDDYDDLKMPI